MNKPKLRAVILSALAIGTMLSAASPAQADHGGFEKAEYQVDEAAGHVELKVGWTCCPPTTGEFDYYTADLSAVAGADYRQTSGTVFATSCECTIRVPIVGDDLFEGGEQFEVKLTNCRASCFDANHGIRRAIVTILDDDPKPSSSSTSLTRSPEQAARSAGGSSARPPSPQSAASGSAHASTPSAAATTPIAESPVHQDDVAPPAETDDRDHAKAVVRNSEHDKGDDSSLVLVALGTLLLVLGAGLWMKKKLGRRLT